MTFKDVAIKNFKRNLKSYSSYFLCSSFSIMLFFMYSTLLFDKSLETSDSFVGTSIIFTISMSAIAVFSIFFINYAFSSFIKSRNKEFGIFLTLGMTPMDIRRIVKIENLLIIAGSFLSGILTGLIFSRLFQMIVLKILHIKNLSYSLNYKSFLITFAVFLIIFALVIGLSVFQTRNLDISEILKESRKSDVRNSKSTLGLIGIAFILTSIVFLRIIAKHEKLNSNGFIIGSYIIFCFSGVYITISGLGGTIFKITHNSNFYYNNILFLTEIKHNFNKNKKILFILSILSSMIVFLCASPFSLYSLCEKIATMDNRSHIEFVELPNINNISSYNLNKIISHSKTPLKIHNKTSFMFLFSEKGSKNLLNSKPIVSERLYNKATNKKVVLKKGEALNIIYDWIPGNHGVSAGRNISMYFGRKKFTFQIKNSLHSKWISGGNIYPGASGLIINNVDFQNIEKALNNKNTGVIHSFYFDNWKKTKPTLNEIQNKFNYFNSHESSVSKNVEDKFKVDSVINTYETLKDGYSLFIFVTSAMGILFFIASGSVLYFKQYTEINDVKAKFYKLYKLGISEVEVKASISKNLKLIFFTPLIFGSILGYSFIYLMTYVVGGYEVINEFMMYATYVVIAYFGFQTLFYLITKKKYIKEVLKGI